MNYIFRGRILPEILRDGIACQLCIVNTVDGARNTVVDVLHSDLFKYPLGVGMCKCLLFEWRGPL